MIIYYLLSFVGTTRLLLPQCIIFKWSNFLRTAIE
jgi:hypothetical protein